MVDFYLVQEFDSGLFSIILGFCQYLSLDNKYFILVTCKFLLSELLTEAGK